MALISREFCLGTDKGRASIISRMLHGESLDEVAKSFSVSTETVIHEVSLFRNRYNPLDGSISTALRNWAMTAPGIEGGTAE